MNNMPYTTDSPLMLTLCLQEGSILISKAVLDALDAPKQIQMLINADQKKLLLRACSTTKREAIVIPPQYYMQFEISGQSLLKKINKLTGWADAMPRVIYGDLLPDLHAVIFDLNNAVPAELQSPIPYGPTN